MYSFDSYKTVSYTHLDVYKRQVLDHVNLENSSVENALFDGCSLHGANFANANLKTASFRYCDLRESNIEGANLFGAVLEYAKLDGIVSNEDTKWFRMHCPETGAFLGYKKCVDVYKRQVRFTSTFMEFRMKR